MPRRKKARRGRPPGSKTQSALKDAKQLKKLCKTLEALCEAIKASGSKQPEKLYRYIGSDQHHTKNLGNFESFGYGFSLQIPTPMGPEEGVEKEETQQKIRSEVEALSGFVSSIMNEVSQMIDKSRGSTGS